MAGEAERLYDAVYKALRVLETTDFGHRSQDELRRAGELAQELVGELSRLSRSASAARGARNGVP